MDMKFSKIITFAIVLSTIGVTHAEWMDESSVKTAAEAFTLNDSIGSTVLKGCSVAGLTQRQNLWIVSLEPSGHIVMSGSDLADPIVGFSKNNFIEPAQDSPAYAILEDASASLATLEAQGGTRHARWGRLLDTTKRRGLLMATHTPSENTVIVEPFLSTHWNQWQPYNDYSPVHEVSTNDNKYRGRTPCGCIATAAAQQLNYFRWPARVDHALTYEHIFNQSAYEIRFDGSLPFDWGSISNEYADSYYEWVTNFFPTGEYSYWQEPRTDLRGKIAESVRYPIARLILFCDSLGHMNFASNGSSANYETVADNIADWYTAGRWIDVSDPAKTDYQSIVAHLQVGIPLQVELAGHQVVAHGWAEDDENKYIYISYGWSGDNDGYYNMDITTSTTIIPELKRILVGHYPRAKPQLDPLPKVCETSTTLNWHFPDFYTNNLSGFTVSISRPATTPSTFFDDFSKSSGTPSSDLFAVGEDSLGYDGKLLYALSDLGSSYFTFPGKYTLTSASVLTFKLRSYYALGNSFEVQARFNDGDWITILEPALFASGDSGWLTERVYLGEHGGETVQLRLFKTFPGGSYYPNTKCILVDDFRVTDVLAPVAPEIRNVGKTERSLTLTGLDAGATYSFTVTPSISGALVDGESSESVSTSIAGTRNTPIPGEQTYTPSTLTFSASDTSGTWSYLGSTTSSTSVEDWWNASITATLQGNLTSDSFLSFSWKANNNYAYVSGAASVVFIDLAGNSTTLWSVANNSSVTKAQDILLPLGSLSGQTGRIKISITFESSNGYSYGKGEILSPQITNVLVPSVPDVELDTETLTALGTPEILSVSSVTEGFYRECGLGATTFEVICSESVTSLTARPSHLALVSDEDVSVTPNGNDRFTVTITPSGVTKENARSRIILTLAATDANGTTTYKDLSLRFSNETQEEYVDAETEVVAGIEWTYTVVDGEASIGGDSYSNPAVQRLTEGDITVPSTLGGYSVTRIGPYAFYNCKKITSITVPDSVTSIGSFAFSGCSGLASVFMEGNCPSVDSDAFANVANGCVVLLPRGNETYEVVDGKWQGMTVEWYGPEFIINAKGVLTGVNLNGATDIVIPDTVTSIGSHAFYGCSGLTSVTIPNGVTNIAYMAFSGCSSLVSVTLPDSLERIWEDAFEDCSEDLFDTTIIPGVKMIDGWAVGIVYSLDLLVGDVDLSGVRGIADKAFYGAFQMTSVTLPYNMECIPNKAFQGCGSLATISIPDSVNRIGAEAFQACYSLDGVTIPASVTTIDSDAFGDCRALSAITIPSTVTNIGYGVFRQCESLVSVSLPDNMKLIPDMMFSGCCNLASVEIPSGVTSIGDYAFAQCGNLSSVNIPESVTRIGPGAFRDCNQLGDAWTIPGMRLVDGWVVGNDNGMLFGDIVLTGVRGLADNAFDSCYGLRSVTFVGDAPYIGIELSYSGVGADCLIRIPNGAKGYDAIEGMFQGLAVEYYDPGVPSFVVEDGVLTLVWLNGATEIVIPDLVTAIGEYVFQQRSEIVSIALPTSLVTIGSYAFSGCEGLASMTIPESVTNIGYYAFWWCSGMTNITFEGDAPYVYENAFGEVANGCVVRIPYGNETYAMTDGKWQGMLVEYLPCEHGGGTSIKNAVVPTCTEAGYTGDTVCAICGVVFESGAAIDPLGHDIVEKKAAKEPTYFEDGWTHEIGCSRCDAIYEASVTIPKLVPHIEFVVTDVKADEAEGSSVEIRVFGGNLDAKSDVNLYLSYNTAAAADLDLAKGAIDGVTPKGGLKFPLTLSWNMGEIREKVITIPVKADKAVEDDEFFSLQLAAPVGMELGDTTICTVTIHDPGYDDLEAKVKSGTATKAEKSAWDKLQNAKAPYVLGLAEPADAGKVAGSGLCANGKKVTLKATANKGFVFMDWCDATGAKVAPTATLVVDRTAKPAASTATSTTLTGVNKDATYYAKFITVEEDGASITLKLLGEDLDSPSVAPTALATNVTCGVALEWPLASYALSATTIKVSGLPAGLKFADKDVLDSKTKQVIVKANTIYGAPTAASAVDKKTGLTKPSEVKITVTTAGKSSVTYLVKLTVDPLPSWVVGTFSGDGYYKTAECWHVYAPYDFIFNLTVANNGKLTGSITVDVGVGKQEKPAAFSAASAAGYDENAHVVLWWDWDGAWYEDVTFDGPAYYYDVDIKLDGKTKRRRLYICDMKDGAMYEYGKGRVYGVATAGFDHFEAVPGQDVVFCGDAKKNIWTDKSYDGPLPKFAAATVTKQETTEDGDVCTFSFKKNGSVAVTIVRADGQRDSASFTLSVMPQEDGAWFRAFGAWIFPKGSIACVDFKITPNADGLVGPDEIKIDYIDVDLDL